jgi:hypothetical protein
MITFECPRCHLSVEALAERPTVVCEHCGNIVDVPRVSDVDTLTLDELEALRRRKPPGGDADLSKP